jgi:hypothetical protein
MTTRLVTLVNPNFVWPPVAPYALDILCTHLEAAGFDVDVLDLTVGATAGTSTSTSPIMSRCWSA